MLDLHSHARAAPKALRWGLAGFLLSAMAAEVGTESVTLSTYYPAPSGVYTQLITTNNTYLARDGGNVGIGTTDPQAKLAVNGLIFQTSLGGFMGYAGGFWRSSANAAFPGLDPAKWSTSQVVNWNYPDLYSFGGADNLLLLSGQAGGSGGYDSSPSKVGVAGDLLVMPAGGSPGNVGIGTTAPAATLDVAGDVRIADGSEGAGKVLTSDANGVASWEPAPGGWGYDSGWFLVTTSGASQLVTRSHGLGQAPTRLTLLQCGAVTSGQCTSKMLTFGHTDYAALGQTGGYMNPLSLLADQTQVYINLAGGAYAWAYWDPWSNPGPNFWGCAGDEDGTCFTAYYRVLASK